MLFCLHLWLHYLIPTLTNFTALTFPWAGIRLKKMRAEWRYLSGDAFMCPLMHLYFQARQHFMKYHQIWNYDHVSVCHWALRCARHLMWGDFVLKQSNVNPDAFESRDIKPTPRLPISWAVGLETMRESEMTGERATVLFLHKRIPQTERDGFLFISLRHWTPTHDLSVQYLNLALSHSLCFGKVLFLFKRLLKTSKNYAAQDIETRILIW